MAGDLATNVGRRIAMRREQLKLTQGQLAAQVGTDAVNNQRISDWERGIHMPNDRHMQDIAKALTKPVAWFYEDGSPAETADLMAALPNADAEQSRLARIESKLDDLLAILRRDEADEPPPPAGELRRPPSTPLPTPDTTEDDEPPVAADAP